MAHERDRPRSVARRRAGEPDTPPDPIGRLDDVLVTLEQMLEDRGVPRSPPRLEDGGPRGGREASEEHEQEPLPLLEDVVAPAAGGGPDRGGGASMPDDATTNPPALREPLTLGFEIVPDEDLSGVDEIELEPPVLEPPTLQPPTLEPEGERYGDAPPPSLEPEVYRHLIDRLANEIDVIVQTGTEEAMRQAAADIAARVREHAAIILPELIEELVRMSNRTPD